MARFDVTVPDLGEFDQVEVIEILVSVGDRVAVEDSLLTLESEKATMELPSPRAGLVQEICVALGDHVSEGQLLVRMEADASESAEPPAAREEESATTEAPPVADARPTPNDMPPASPGSEFSHADVDVLVLGAGPGGYTAAFRAADLGLRVALVERHAELGGVCLNVGCIPSKALLHVAEVLTEVRELADHGVRFGDPEIDLDQLRAHKEDVVRKLTGGLAGLAKRRGVEVLRGEGRFEDDHRLCVTSEEGDRVVTFAHAIIAVGSHSAKLPGIPYDDPRVVSSTGALALEDIPEKLLVIGGGVIGLELAAVYHALGSRVSVVEWLDELLAGADRDVVKPLERVVRDRYEDVWTGSRVAGVEAQGDGLLVRFEGKDVPETALFDRVLVAVGRRPNGSFIGADRAGVDVDERGFIRVDEQQRTNVPHIFAIGDVVGEPMLAHKATHQGKVAAEVIAGEPASFDPRAIPAVAYTDPEVAWMGLTETEARATGVRVRRERFPWAASGRALGVGRPEGQTKLLFDAESGRLVGAAIVGPNAGELIAETVLALEMGSDAEDMSLTIHPHPTLSETVAFAAEMANGTITDLYVPKRSAKDRSDPPA